MDFIQKITKEGGELYLVGGTMRDRYYNKFFGTKIAPKDYDLLVCKLALNKLEKILRVFGNVKEIGKAFGILTFKPTNAMISQHEFDIALPRKEQSTGSGYREFEIVSDPFISLEEDLQRRDVTVNAIAYRLYKIDDMLNPDINDEHTTDIFGGKNDIQNKILRSVGNSYKRLLEDPTRIMRALRQSAQFDMVLHEDLRGAIIQHSGLLKLIVDTAPVRIVEELTRLLQTATSVPVIDFMFNETDIFKLLDISVNSTQSHNILNALEISSKYDMPIHVKFAILLHYVDIERWVRKFELSAAPHFPKKDIKFVCMSTLGMKMLEDICNENTKYRRTILIRRLIQTVDKNRDQNLKDYGLLGRCICWLNDQVLVLFEEDKDIIRTTAEVKLKGDTLKEKYGYKGKEIGKIKQWLFEEITLQRVSNNIPLLENYLKKYQPYNITTLESEK